MLLCLAASRLTCVAATPAQGEAPVYDPSEMVFDVAEEAIPELPKHMRGDDDSDFDEDEEDMGGDGGPSTSAAAGAAGGRGGGRGQGGRAAGRGAGRGEGGRGKGDKAAENKRKREDAVEKEQARRINPLPLRRCCCVCFPSVFHVWRYCVSEHSMFHD